ncbi:MAG: amidohydrolase family protein [Nitrososphaerales archaeon]
MSAPYILPLSPPHSILIQDAKLVLASSGPPKRASILVSERKIKAIGEEQEIRKQFGSWDESIDARECIAMPGLVNTHSHIAMSLLRGLAEDLPLLRWLQDRIWPLEAKLKPEHIEIGASLGAVEALLSGTTTMTSIYFYDRTGSEASALYDVGMRGVLAHGIFDWTEEKSLKKTEEFVQEWHGKDEGRIRVATSPHAPYSCSPELLKKIEALREVLNQNHGRQYPVLNTLHVAEARGEAAEIESKYKVHVDRGVAAYLDSLAVLNSDTIAAHSVHLTDDDYVAFKKDKAAIASCPISNLKVGMGVADLPRALSEGITVGLGTDGPASNNTLDMFETVKMASLLSKGLKGDTTLMSAKDTFDLATVGGARALHQENEIGGLAPGMKADIVLLDLTSVSALPFYDPYHHIVYSARSGDVRDVFVDGRQIVKNRQILSVDLEKLRQKVISSVPEILESTN